MNNTTGSIVDKNGVILDEKSIGYMIWASNVMLPRLAKAWNVACPRVVYYTGQYQPTAQDWQFHIINEDPKNPGAEAYHTEENAVIDGYILAKTIIDNGGFILSDVSISNNPGIDEIHVHGSTESTVAGALFHELAEALLDDTVNGWWQSDQPLTIIHATGSSQSQQTFSTGMTLCCSEICDPVQQNFVVIKCGTVDIALSDFILPAWKDNQNTKGPYNYINTLKTPLMVDLGGYVVIMDSNGNSQQVFSDKIPETVKAYKKKSYRANKRDLHF
jgi:hypothetical protein